MAALAVIISLNASGTAPVSDALFPDTTITLTDPFTEARFRPKQLIVPAVFIGVGVWGLTSGGKHFNHGFNRKLGLNNRPLSDGIIDDLFQFFPDIVVIMPDRMVGYSPYVWRERAAMLVTGELINEIILQTLKHTVDSPRPDGSDTHSFPSGHTARAFLGAELARESYGIRRAFGAYGLAAIMGIMRVVEGRHYVTDVIAGAGIGILSARLATLLLPLERRLFKWDSTIVIPAAGPRGFQLTASITF